MILLAHMLFGAAIGSTISNPILAALLALLGHYLLDSLPHIEYSIDNIRHKNWLKATPDAIKVFLDFSLAISLILLISDNQPIIYICAFAAIIPDSLTILSSISNNRLLKLHDKFHAEKIHYLTKQKNFPAFWKISTQIIVIVISIIGMKI